jgi:hypothetical protein
VRVTIRISLNQDRRSHVRNYLQSQWRVLGVRQVYVPGTRRTTGTWEGHGLTTVQVSQVMTILANTVANPVGVVPTAHPTVSFDHIWVYSDEG